MNRAMIPTSLRRPKYARCDFCGRNTHKVAVHFPKRIEVRPRPFARPGERPDEVIRHAAHTDGYCPSCWTGGPNIGTGRAEALADRIAAGEAIVLYDHRTRR